MGGFCASIIYIFLYFATSSVAFAAVAARKVVLCACTRSPILLLSRGDGDVEYAIFFLLHIELHYCASARRYYRIEDADISAMIFTLPHMPQRR